MKNNGGASRRCAAIIELNRSDNEKPRESVKSTGVFF